MMPKEILKILMLGTPKIIWQDHPFSLTRRQARALLFYLASDLHPISRQQLNYLFWPDRSEKLARKNLNRLLSYLHKALPNREMLILNEDSVLLNPGFIYSDVNEFKQLCADGNIENCRQAIDLYRSAFLEGFYLPHNAEYDLWLTEKRQGYERLYLSATAKLVHRLMDNGAYQEAIPYALGYLEIDNLAEEMHRDLIVCYAAIGKRAEVQAQYERMVIALEQELGVIPLPETVRIYQASLRGELPSQHPLPKPTTWSVLPSFQVPLLGRQEAWQQLEAACRRFLTGGVILISGEAGIGKSRLLMEFVTQNEKYVINGNAYSSTQNLAYQPVIQALQVALPYQWLWEGVANVWLAEVSLILPSIREYFPDLPERVLLNPQQAQARLFEALTQIFLTLAANASPLYLCLDDLQWADPMTLEWLQHLAPRIANSNLCILATHRNEKAQGLTELRRLLNRTGKFQEIALGGLKRSAIEEMVTLCEVKSHVDEFIISRLEQITGGNPFFILEILSGIRESDSRVNPEALPITHKIQTIVETRLSRLTMVARQVLEASAVLSPRLEAELIERTSGRQEFELLEALDELANHNVLMVDDEGYRFRHELIRQTVYQGLSKWRAQLLHKRAAGALEALYNINLQVEYGQIAFHYDCAGLAEQAVKAYYAAAQSAQEIYAYQTAINFLERGIQLLPEVQLEPELIANLYELLGDCQNNIGDFNQARQCYNQSQQSLGESNALLTADLLRKSAATFSGEFAIDQAITLLDHALDILDEKTENQAVNWQRCWLDVQLERIWVFYLKAVPEKIDEISTQIKPYIEQVGTPRQRIRFYSGLNYAVVRKNRYQVSREVVDSERRSLNIAREAGDEVIISECEFNTGILSFLHGDVESAIELLSTGLARAQKLGLHPIELQCCVYLIAAHRVQGNLEAVQEFIPGCLEIADRIGQPNYQGAALTHQGWLHYHFGDYAQAEQSAAKALEFWDATKTYPFQWMGLWLLLAMAFSQGEIELALQYVARITDPIQQAPPPEIETLLQSALQASKEGQGEKVKSALESALKLARLQGYL